MPSRNEAGFRGRLETTAKVDGLSAPEGDGDPVALQLQLAEFYLQQAGFKATPLAVEATSDHPRRPPGPTRADAGLARLCTVQAAQLAVLAGTADALAHQRLDGVLAQVLATCLDMAAISRGVLYLVEPGGHLALREHVGFPESAVPELRACFGHEQRLLELLDDRRVNTIPSPAVTPAMADDLLGQFAVASMLVVPVTWGDALQGALLLGAPRTDAAAEQSIAFARVLGMQVAQAIALARAFDRTTQAEHRYRALMEGAHDAVAVLTPEGRIVEVNRRWEELLFLPRTEIEGRLLRELTLPSSTDGELGHFSRAIETGSPSHATLALRRSDGVTVLMELSNAAMDIAGERLVLSIGRDVTEQVRGRAQRMLSDRLASVGMLASGVAHEINNPLAAVVTNLELAGHQIASLARQHGPLTDLEEELADARSAAERVRLIVKDLATFAREDEDGIGPVDVKPILESALRMARNEIRHRARVVARYGDVPRVLGNDSRLGQVFLNLLVNAAHAIEEGQVDRNQITVTLGTDPTGFVTIEVRDSGVGMSPEVLGRLFTPFFTTKRIGVGTGLGLAICQRIVADAGGEITVSSEVGRGTTVRVRLPAAPAKSEPKPPVLPVSRARVMIVDDDPMVMRGLRRVLAESYEVTTFSDAGAALAAISDGTRYDLIVSDLIMPRVTGMDLHAALLEVAPDQAARMTFLTGGAFTTGARAFLERWPNRHLEKPVEGKALKAFIHERMSALGTLPRE